jgi:hypothetical protein
MEDNLKKNEKEWKKTFKKIKKWKTTSKTNKKNFSRFLSNLGANLSWGWLCSLRL